MFDDPKVAAVFDAIDEPIRGRLLTLREMVFDTAANTPGVGALEETLKWGQPSYLTPSTKSGSTIRIDKVKSNPEHYAMYFHCQTSLVGTFRELYSDEFTFIANRCILFDVKEEVPTGILRHCIALALTYHLRKRG